MDISGWIEYHDKKAEKRTGTIDSTLHPAIVGKTVLITDEKEGAFQFVVSGATMYITGIVGNFGYWECRMVEYAKANGITRFVGYTCSDNPDAVARLMGMEITNTWVQLERGIGRCAFNRQLKPK